MDSLLIVQDETLAATRSQEHQNRLTRKYHQEPFESDKGQFAHL